ncbi:MAG: VIT1/CCC1 transporter family protein [Thermoplasmata archaeon]|nr:MAG: VIT1/CCC1 transporter family protein [Thermoplasmata archaeon]
MKLISEDIKEMIPARYTVLGTIDGVIACLAIVLGVSAASVETNVIIAAGLSAGIGLGVSNGIGGFMAEYTVEMKRLRKIERAMIAEKGKLDGTLISKNIRKKLFFDTLTHGGCSFLGAMVPIIPFLFDLDLAWLLLSSIIVSLCVLFALGIYMGIVIKEHLMISGFKMVIVGLLVAILVRLLGFGH